MNKTKDNPNEINVDYELSLFKERFISLRKQNKLTQAELADELEITRSLLASWETGRRIPDAIHLVMISRFFNISIDYLLGISDSKQKSFKFLKD